MYVRYTFNVHTKGDTLEDIQINQLGYSHLQKVMWCWHGVCICGLQQRVRLTVSCAMRKGE